MGNISHHFFYEDKMYISPPLLITFVPTSIKILKRWTEYVTGDPYKNLAYQWTVTLTIMPQKHGDKFTKTPYAYNGLDIVKGMWLTNKTGGFVYKIINIHDGASATSVTLDIEDIDRLNLMFDTSKQGTQAVLASSSKGYIFSLDEETNMPILAGITSGLLSSQLQSDLQSRFLYRNYVKNNIRVNQPNHNLVIGDVIFMDTDGLYKTISASKDNRNNIGKIVGKVTDISIPGVDWFTYKPRGDYQTTISPALPDSSPGSLIYLDPDNAGQLTAEEPKIYATPVYIRLGSSSEGIYLMGGSGSGGSSGPLGYNSSVYTVATIADRDLLDTTLMNPGDQVYVEKDPDGVWGYYLASSIDSTQNPPVITWIKICDQFSSQTDAGTTQQIITYQTPSPITLATVKSGVRVINVTIDVTEVFSSDAALTVGDDVDATRLVDNDDLDLTVISSYSIVPNYDYDSTTVIKSFLAAGGSSTGKATITISYL